jgi:hypothetical protein
MSVFLVALSALALFVGWKWGVIAIHSGTVERRKNPGLFWAVMTLAGFLFVAGLAFLVRGK